MALNEAYGQTDVMHDPNYVRTLLASHDPRQRAQGAAALKDMQGREAHQQQLHEFEQREADRQLAREGGLAARQVAHEGNLAAKQANTDQRTLAAEELNQRGQAAEADKKTAIMAHLLANPDALRNVQGTGPDSVISRAIISKMLQESKVSATLPVDPKVAALARSKGLPEPQPTILGGTSVPTTAAPTTTAPQNTTADGSSPRGAFAGDLASGSQTQYPVLPNTPEPRFVPLGHGSLEGSREVAGGIQTPSGGFIGTDLTPGVEKLIGRGENKPQFGATEPETFGGHGAGSSFGENAGIDHLVGKAPAQQPTAPTPEPNVAGEAFKRTNQDLGNIGQSMEPFTIAKNALGGLFSGGQGGANDIVKQPTPQVTPPAPQATPAPGTQFQGPLTATAGFLSSPNAPAPQPALTPPAIPPTKKPTPEEERQRMALQQ